MSKDKNSHKAFTEEDTKNLVRRILDNNNDNNKVRDKEDLSPIFDIEYEDYETKQEDYEYMGNKKVKNKKPKKEKVNYRKNIEKYSQDFFEDNDEDDYDYDYDKPSLVGKAISVSIVLLLIISTSLLAVKLVSTREKLKEANSKIEELLDNKQKTENKLMEESLRNEIEELKEENSKLKGIPNDEIKNDSNISNKQTPSSNNLKQSEYIVKEGDIIWNISKQVYGNGSYYQKILDANGLTENSILKPGQKLIIPKIS